MIFDFFNIQGVLIESILPLNNMIEVYDFPSSKSMNG